MGGGLGYSTHKPDRTVEVRVGIDMYDQYKDSLKIGDLLTAEYAGFDDDGDANDGDYDVYLPSDTDTDKIKIGTMLSKSKPKYKYFTRHEFHGEFGHYRSTGGESL